MSDVIPGWSDVRQFAAKRIEELRTSIESAPAESIPSLQGQIKAFRETIALPDTMMLAAADIASADEPSGY